MHKEKAVIIVIFWLLYLPAYSYGQSLESLFQNTCKAEGISTDLVMAIAKQESGLNPWAVNIEGKSYMPANKKEAARLITRAYAAGQSFDVGLMQINSRWIKLWKIKPETLLDPETNIKAGIKILAGEIARHGFTWQAVGKYHTPQFERGQLYAWKIYENANGKQVTNTRTIKSSHHAKQKVGLKAILLYRRKDIHRRAGN